MSGHPAWTLCEFPGTHWSLVSRAGWDSCEMQRAALAELLKRYRLPLTSHLVVRKRIDPDHADDLLQAFIVSQILERDLIRRAQRERGRFRTFLLTALDRYVLNEIRNQQTRERHFQGAVAIIEGREPASPQATPDEAFDVDWAREVLAEVLRRMRAECQGLGRDAIWDVFQIRVLDPLFSGSEPLPYAQLVDRLGFISPAQASNALITSKRMFVRVLRGVIGEYELDSTDVDAEIANLRRILSGGAQARSDCRES